MRAMKKPNHQPNKGEWAYSYSTEGARAEFAQLLQAVWETTEGRLTENI